MQNELTGSLENITVWWRDGQLVTGNNQTAPAIPPNSPPKFSRVGNTLQLIASTPPGEIILVTRDISPDLAELTHTAWKLVAAGAGVLALGLLGGWWAAGRSLRPLASMSATAEHLSAGNLGERIHVPDRDNELGQLASALNAMLERLDTSFAQQTRFISDAAHELRTPVTVMLTQTQMALLRDRPAEQYRQSLEACQRAAGRMRQLIESLLTLARLDAGEQPMKRLRFDLSQTIREQLELVQPLADVKSVTLASELNPLPIQGDPDYLTTAVANLLTNAIHYNEEGGSVLISLQQEDNDAVIRVTDTGMGMDSETCARIFDRFYRADQSRSLPAGRTGLGLAITKSIVDAHQGTIEVESTPGKGSTFVVRIPSALNP